MTVAHERRRAPEERGQARRQQNRATATQAAIELRRSAVAEEGRWRLSAGIILGPLMADTTMKYIGFILHGGHRIAVTRKKLVQCRRALKVFNDLSAFIDQRGLHFRWRGGRGGLDLIPQLVARSDVRVAQYAELTAPEAGL